MKRSKLRLKTVDGYEFENGKTYYYIYYRHSVPDIGRIKVHWSRHRWSKRTILRCRDLDGGAGGYHRIDDALLRPDRLYREYANAIHELNLILINMQKMIDKQTKKYWQKAKQRGLLDGNTLWYSSNKIREKMFLTKNKP